MNPNENGDLVRVHEAAVAVEIGTCTVYNWIRSGRIEAHNRDGLIGIKRGWLVSLRAVDALAKAERMGRWEHQPEVPPADLLEPAEVLAYRTGDRAHTSPVARLMSQSDLKELIRRRAIREARLASPQEAA